MAERGIGESAALLSILIMGLVAAIHFLEKFEMELKPLVLAFVFVSILEGVVQFFEWLFVKLMLLCKNLPRKIWQLLRLIYRTSCQPERDVTELRRKLKDWGKFKYKWRAEDAGRYMLFRALAIVITLVIVAFVSLVIHGLLIQQWNIILDRFDTYEHQFESISDFVSERLPNITRSLPQEYRNETEKMISEVEASLARPRLFAKVKEVGLALVNGILQSSSTILMQTVFFLLYTAFMLADPLHINLGSEAGEVRGSISSVEHEAPMPGGLQVTAATPLMTRGLTFLREATGSAVATAQDVSPRPSVLRRNMSNILERFELTELQQYLYKIMWNYFLLTVLLNAIFALSVLLLLILLKVDLSVIFALACFFLNFIPEIGPIIATLLPAPFILLTPTEDCEHGDPACITDFQHRLARLLSAVTGILLIKFLVSNLLYSVLMGRNKTLAGAIKDDVDEVRETHGVIVLFAVVFFGKIWGTVGMLISVPVLSMVRLSVNMHAAEAGVRKGE